MRNITFSVLIMACFSIAYSQQSINEPCQCDKDFAFVANYVEHHYSGFQDNVTNDNRAAYEGLKEQIIGKSREQQSFLMCLALLKRYLSFFRDNHLQIRTAGNSSLRVNEKSPDEVRKFKEGQVFQSAERIDYDSTKIWSYLSGSADELEGVYENDVYQIAVLQNKTGKRDYCGVITKSKTVLWEKGQVKMEIKKNLPFSFFTVLYLRNHAADLRIVETGNPVLAMMADLKKIYPIPKYSETTMDYSRAPAGKWFQFIELNDSTCYLHIKTFDGSLKNKFDSADRSAFKVISRKPNLIVDIRDNGGGSDRCWQELHKYLYTQPIQEEAMAIYCSPETIKRYEELLAGMQKNRKGYGWRTIKFMKIKLRKMKKAPSESFLPFEKMIPWYARPFVNADHYKQRKVYVMPRKVILIYNRNSGSAAEGLIINAQQSKKVLTFGENSNGCIAFGNIVTVNTPSGYVMQVGTSRSQNRFQFEKTGIPPQHHADEKRDWVEQTNELWKLIK